MSKFVKQLIMAELKSRYAEIESACVVDLTGMDVHSTESLRAQLRDRSARVEVVKNALARQAFKGSKLEPLGSVLEGPCALVTSEDSIIQVAKTLVDAAKKFKTLSLKQAIVEGDPSITSVEAVSKMRDRGDLLAELAMLIMSPARSVAGCIGGPQARVAGCLKAIAGKEAA